MNDDKNNQINKFLISDLQEGMRFSAPVFFDDGENMFLPEDLCIKKKHLEVLVNWKIPFVLSYGKPSFLDFEGERN